MSRLNIPEPTVPIPPSPFGTLTSFRLFDAGEQLELARLLNATYIRSFPVLLKVSLDCQGCEDFARAGLRVVLTVRNTARRGDPSTPPLHLAAYERDIGTIIDRYHPALLVVENEEDTQNFFTGTPEQYGQMLQAACRAAHQRNTPCANGGLLSAAVTFLTYQRLMDSGRSLEASTFAERTFEPQQRRLLANPTSFGHRLARIQAFLAEYEQAGADYLNFHWYVPDADALAQCAQELVRVTGMHLVTSEIGQRNDDPALTTALMDQVVKLGMPIAVWFAADATLARGLVNADGSLRPTGVAFQTFIRDRFGP